MRVLLIGNYPNQRQESMQRFARMLYKGLTQCGVQVRLLRPEPFFGKLRPTENGIGKWLGYVDRLLLFPFVLVREAARADIVHICDHGNALYVPFLAGKANVVTCHDLIGARIAEGEIVQQKPGLLGRWLGRAMLNGLESAQSVICVSFSTQRDFARLIPDREASRTTVIANGLNYPFRPMSHAEASARVRALKVPPGPFVLHVGGNQWYKNRPGLLRIFDSLRRLPGFESLKMVLVGQPMSPWMRDYVSVHNLQEHVVECVEPQDEDLRALYSLAAALIFPSLEEGFGWPVVEAQACGCPVFTSAIEPLTTIAGNAAAYFEPNRPDEAAILIAARWHTRPELRQLGLDNVRQFSADRMIERYIQHYQQLLRHAEMSSIISDSSDTSSEARSGSRIGRPHSNGKPLSER